MAGERDGAMQIRRHDGRRGPTARSPATRDLPLATIPRRLASCYSLLAPVLWHHISGLHYASCPHTMRLRRASPRFTACLRILIAHIRVRAATDALSHHTTRPAYRVWPLTRLAAHLRVVIGTYRMHIDASQLSSRTRHADLCLRVASLTRASRPLTHL